ncbi:MAG: nuclear transport factor 2 family protein [Deltaproteobacteria bacterium]|nr:nuclear transport factor 2 family protein [Deltaproteobacteria bacterium]
MTRMTLGTALIAGLLLAPMGANAGERTNDEKAVKAAVEAFKRGGESRDVASLGSVLHEDFRVLFTWTHEPGVTRLDKAGYLGLLEAGKIGGTAGTIEFADVQVRDEIAIAEATIVRGDARFESSFTLLRGEQGWTIVQDAVVVEAKESQ